MRRVVVVLALVSVALTGLLIVQSCASARRDHPVVDGRVGFTECFGPAEGQGRAKGRVWIRGDLHGTPLGLAVLAHERKHAEQMARFDSCEDAVDWYSRNTVEAEAEAFCAMAQVMAQRGGMTLDGAIFEYARWLQGYDPRLSMIDAIEVIRAYCRPGVDPAVRVDLE